jgi:hypothetical protein
MANIKEVQKVVQLENERNRINACVAHLERSHLWTDQEKSKLLGMYSNKLAAINKSLTANPFL